jgi:hypothetical protein
MLRAKGFRPFVVLHGLAEAGIGMLRAVGLSGAKPGQAFPLGDQTGVIGTLLGTLESCEQIQGLTR